MTSQKNLYELIKFNTLRHPENMFRLAPKGCFKSETGIKPFHCNIDL